MATRDDVQVGLRILRAGVPGEHPAVDEDTINVWGGALAAFSLAVIVSAAERWAENEPRFPSLLAFLSACQQEARRAASERAALERPAGWIGSGDLQFAKCAECGGSDWVEVPDARRPDKIFVRPCRTCRPADAERYDAGHMDPAHDRFACSDEDCRKLAGRRR